jgi:hypothetical protein
MTMPDIQLTTPVVVPAQETKTYDLLWLSELHIHAPDPNVPVRMVAQLDKMRRGSDGTAELEPAGSVRVIVPDIAAAELADADLAALVGQVLTALRTKANL